MLTHRGLLSTCRVVSADWQFGSDNVFGNTLPTFHVAGMTMLLLTLYADRRLQHEEDHPRHGS